MKIDVTQDDIDWGRRRSSICCPIALALNRALPEKADWCVRTCDAEWSEGGVVLPPSARDFIWAYDFGHPVQPFFFDLEIGQ